MRIAGEVAPKFESVRDAFEEGQATDPGGAQLCIYHHGAPVVDLWTETETADGPYGRDSLTTAWSTSKGILAICMAMLIEKGLLDVDAPVRNLWPEFSTRGKQDATTAHLLAHTVGLPTFPVSSGIRGSDFGDRDRCVETLADATPLWTPGATQGFYHAFTYGFLVSEVLRRITKGTEGDFLAEHVSARLGLDLWIGLPQALEPRVHRRSRFGAPEDNRDTRTQWAAAGVDTADPRVVELLGGLDLVNADDNVETFVESPAGRSAEIPAANAVGTARSIARLYAATIGDVEGVRLLSRHTIDFVRASRVRGLPRFEPLAPLGDPFDRGLGFWLSDSQLDPYLLPDSFGHPGAGGVHGFATPTRGIAGAYTCTSLWIPQSDPRLLWRTALANTLGAHVP